MAVLAGFALTSVVRGQSEKWYPSKWGAEDQRGAANRITPAKVLQAKALITQGRVYQLGRVYEAGMPMPATRHFSLHIPQAYVLGGKNEGVWKAVENKIQKYKQLAQDLQNKDGSFSTEYFQGPGKSPAQRQTDVTFRLALIARLMGLPIEVI